LGSSPHQDYDGKKDRLEITKPLMAQADTDWRFYGRIYRGSDSVGHPVIPDRIKVNNGFELVQAAYQDILGRKLDEMVRMVVDYSPR
jgi:hypothetical protein